MRCSLDRDQSSVRKARGPLASGAVRCIAIERSMNGENGADHAREFRPRVRETLHRWELGVQVSREVSGPFVRHIAPRRSKATDMPGIAHKSVPIHGPCGFADVALRRAGIAPEL